MPHVIITGCEPEVARQDVVDSCQLKPLCSRCEFEKRPFGMYVLGGFSFGLSRRASLMIPTRLRAAIGSCLTNLGEGLQCDRLTSQQTLGLGQTVRSQFFLLVSQHDRVRFRLLIAGHAC